MEHFFIPSKLSIKIFKKFTHHAFLLRILKDILDENKATNKLKEE